MPVTAGNKWLKGVTVAALAATVTFALPVLAAPSVQERLDSLERKVDARGLIDMLTRVEQLQRDLQQLRGDIEVQNHALEALRRSQREQYLDMDRRLQQLETGQPGGAAAAGSPSLAPAPVVEPPVTTRTEVAPAQEFDFSPSGGAPAAAVVENPQDEKAEYDTALAILRDGRYSDAALAFKQFIASYPNGTYADNAYYWLGETYYVTREFDQAQAAFRELTTRFPQSTKLADSRLKLGYIYYEKQDWKAARSELEGLVKDWPASTAARLANERLARMKQERH